jgi:ribosomal protein S18 acetylase RimI-like enzyme
MIIRTMTLKDYDKVYELWSGIKGFALRSLDDSREGVGKFLKRNPDTSVVAEENGRIIGTILSGHDGRSGNEQISKVSLIAFCSNEIGNKFWQDLGFTLREDINSYDCVLNEGNKYNINS